jgi:DNA-binding SARP family transcriptional activator
MARELTVRLLGHFSLARAGAELAGAQSARLQALLAYLLLHRDAPQSRQQLAFLFWPDTTEAQAHTNLRQLLHALRHRLPEADAYLEVTDRTIQWRAAAPFTLDVAQFEAALAEAAGAAGSARLATLERAIATYGGELLPGCYDDWLLLERARLAERFLDALEQLTLLLEQRRDYDHAIEHAERLLRHDTLHEATYRHLMRLHAINGDRAAALRVYHTCVTILERELGVPPGAETVEVYRHLVDLDHNVAPAPMPSGDTHFVGRQAEWRTLQEAWHSVKRGGLHCVCLSGEPGIGKTRLAEEMIHWAGQQGIATAATRAYAGGGTLAYAPLVELLRTEALRPRVTQQEAVWRSELARLLPELLAEDPKLPRPEPPTGRGQVQRLYDAVGRVLLQPDQPLILLLDDLQWFDAESLAWLDYLLHVHWPTTAPARHMPRLLVLITVRPEAVDEGHLLARLLVELRCSSRFTELGLAPFSADETAELAARTADDLLDGRTTAAIFRATEGNPLFVVETVRAGLTPMPDGGAVLPAVVAPKVQAVIRARLAQLSPAAGELVGLAAAIGRSFAYDVLALASDQDEDTVVRSLDELWRRRIIREHGTNAYDFTHDRLRDVAYLELSLARRRLLHRRLARALETLHAQDTTPVSAQLAHHYEHAGQTEWAIHHLRAAAGHACRVYAYRESIAFLNHGLDLLRSLPASPVTLELELELQMALCTSWAAVTDYLGAEVAAAYHRALALYREIKHEPHLFTVLWGLQHVALNRREFRESLELAQECLRIAEQLDDPGLWLQAHHAAWRTYNYLGEWEQVFLHIEHGLAHYDRASHEALSVQYGMHDAGDCALHVFAMGLWNRGYITQARCKLDAAIALGQELTLPANIADSCTYSGLVFYLLRAPQRAQALVESALKIVERGFPHPGALGATVLGWSLAAQGRAAEGVALAEQGVAASGYIGQRLRHSHSAAVLAETYIRAGQHKAPPPNFSITSAMLAETYILAGRYDAAVAVADVGIAEFGRFRDLLCAPDLWRLKGDALHALGAADDQVEACYQDALALARELRAKVSELRAAVSLAHLRQRQGRPAEGYRLLHDVYSWFTEGFEAVDLQSAAQLLQELAPA